MEIKEIINMIVKSVEETGLRVLDSDILNNSIKIYLRDNKKQVVKNNITKPNIKNNVTEEATEKQIKYLESLGYNGNLDITKLEAQKLIDELKTTLNLKEEYI